VRVRRLAAWCAAALAAAAVGVCAIDAARDRADLDAAARRIADARSALARRAPGDAIDALREAGERLGAYEARPAWRHAWMLVAGSSRDATLRDAFEACVREAGAALDARAAFLSRLKQAFERIERSVTLEELDAADRELEALAADAGADPEALAPVREASARARTAYERDVARNREALATLAATLDRAATPAELRTVMDAVLPARARGSDAGVLRAITGRAAVALDRMLRERLDAAERDGADALDAARAEALAERIERDPDLARPGHPSVGERARTVRASLRARADALGAWEACLRSAVTAVERGDWAAAHASARDMRANLDAWERAAPGVAARVAPAVARIDAAVDRGRYEALLRAPCLRHAREYLEGAPTHPRSMAEPVRAWLAAAGDAPLRVELASIRWAATGAPVPGRTLEDRPDARVDLRVEDAPGAQVSFADVVEGAVSRPAQPVACEWRAHDGAIVRLGIRITIDLRDAIAADPVAIGALAASADALAARRTVVLEARDPAWSGRPHEVTLRAEYAGVPGLPAFGASISSAP
jgi:hypothetical protein